VIFTVRIGYQNFAQDWFQKCSTGAYKMQRIAFSLTSSEQHHKDGDEFLNSIVQVAGDETWVSFVNDKTKEQSKQCVATH
jgi:hypothetical protein